MKQFFKIFVNDSCPRQFKHGSTNLRAPPYSVAINSPAKPGEFLKIIITNSGNICKKIHILKIYAEWFRKDC